MILPNKRVFTTEFKLQVVHEVDAGKAQAQVAREHQVNPNTKAQVAQALQEE